eukprot:scaffold261_cov336-Pavlova_lutheri.AAC.1
MFPFDPHQGRVGTRNETRTNRANVHSTSRKHDAWLRDLEAADREGRIAMLDVRVREKKELEAHHLGKGKALRSQCRWLTCRRT